jgi:uncharacterized protein (TIGR03435 family)
VRGVLKPMHILLLILMLKVAAQTTRPPEFEVATVKPVVLVPGQPISINLGQLQNGRVTLRNVTLSDAIKFAYDLQSDDQIIGSPWIKAGDTRYEIVGQAAPDTTREQAMLMVQSLLVERMKLALHEEKRELPHLALTVAKGGHKMTPVQLAPNPPAPRLGAGRVEHPQMRMSILATLLSRFERQLVLDETGLSGFFKVALQWTPENIRVLARPDGTPVQVNGQTVDAYGPSLFTAIQEQLGLRLEARRGPVTVYVVDRAEKVPVEN